MYLIERCSQISISYFDIYGQKIEKELDPIDSRVVLHEFDHLEGKIFYENYLDKVSINSLLADNNFYKNWYKEQLNIGYLS